MSELAASSSSSSSPSGGLLFWVSYWWWFCALQQGGGKKVLGVYFKGGEYANNPRFLACAENELGIREWLESKGHTYVVTSDKDGPDSRKLKSFFPLSSFTSEFHTRSITTLGGDDGQFLTQTVSVSQLSVWVQLGWVVIVDLNKLAHKS